MYSMIRKYSTKEKGHTSNVCPFGARGGSRTRTPLRALAPEASESTNSTTRASGLAFRVAQRKRYITIGGMGCQLFFSDFFDGMGAAPAERPHSSPDRWGNSSRRSLAPSSAIRASRAR